VRDLGALPGDDYSAAIGINRLGQVVGVSGSSRGRGFIWRHGAMRALRGLPEPERPAAIDDAGTVVGFLGPGDETDLAYAWHDGALRVPAVLLAARPDDDPAARSVPKRLPRPTSTTADA
jgi:hypothetical protein